MNWSGITLHLEIETLKKCIHLYAIVLMYCNKKQRGNSGSAGLHMTEVALESTWLMMLLKVLWFHDEVI